MTLLKNNHLHVLIDELFNQAPAKLKEANWHHSAAANILEHENSYELIISAPGRLKQDFSLEVVNSTLTVAYTPQQQSTETATSTKYIKNEFSTLAFKRSFTLDDKIDTENIGARYENGLLYVQLPKKESVKAGNKSIAIL